MVCNPSEKNRNNESLRQRKSSEQEKHFHWSYCEMLKLQIKYQSIYQQKLIFAKR